MLQLRGHTSKNKNEFYQILHVLSKILLDNYVLYKYKDQVKPLQSPNLPRQNPGYVSISRRSFSSWNTEIDALAYFLLWE